MRYNWTPISRGAWSGARYWRGSDAPRVDAYLVWADATRFTDLLRTPRDVRWLPLLIELKHGHTAGEWAGLVHPLRAWLRVPYAYRNPPAGLGSTRHCTALVRPPFFTKLRTESRLRDFIERFEFGLPSIGAPQPEVTVVAPDVPPRMPRRTPAVVIGSIDDDFAFANGRFREAGARTTRIEYLWSQDGSCPVDGFDYGREWPASEINAAFSAAQSAGHVDEDEVYRRAGYHGARQRLAHGTHVMDLSGGADPDSLKGDDARHVCVQLPARDSWGLMPLGPQTLDGLRYVVDRADRIARGRSRNRRALAPIVVSFPHANLGGPHDGSAILEKAMDELLVQRNEVCEMGIVLPTGNNFLSRCHAQFDLAPARSKTMEWRVLPDDATPNFLEVWMPSPAAAATASMFVTPPAGAEEGPFRAGDVMALQLDGEIVCTVVFLEHAANGGRPMALIVVAPTSTDRRPQRGREAPCGIWKVRVENGDSRHHEIEAWIQRDDPVLGKPRYGRQSHFEDPAYVRFDTPSGRLREVDDAGSYVKRDGSINGISSGSQTVVIGGFRRNNGAPSSYSGSTSVRARYPDAMAVSDESSNRRGVLASGTRSGSAVSMDGTSVAVGQIARYLAETMTKTLHKLRGYQLAPSIPPRIQEPVPEPSQTPSPGRTRVERFAIKEEYPRHWPTPKPPQERGGFGRTESPPLYPRKR